VNSDKLDRAIKFGAIKHIHILTLTCWVGRTGETRVINY